MQIDISFKHMESSEALRSYALEKSEKLKKFFDGKIHITWNFVVEKESHVAHAHLVGNHMDYFAESDSGDMYQSVDLTIDKIERQIQKKKEIVKNKLHRD